VHTRLIGRGFTNFFETGQRFMWPLDSVWEEYIGHCPYQDQNNGGLGSHEEKGFHYRGRL